MQQLRAKRVIVAFITLVSALFTQLAIAGYICPEKQLSQAIDMAVASSADNGAMSNCDSPDPEQPGLCKVHSQGTEPLLDRIAAAGAAPGLVALPVTTVIPVSPPTSNAVTYPAPSSLVRQSEPSVSIRHCCFRI